jgi:flagellar hook-basal body complex protein FliE
MSQPVAPLRILPAEMETPASRPSGAGESDFMETLRGAMDQVEGIQQTAESKVSSLLEGNGMDVHSALIAVEKADLSFQLMMQVRNKIVAAYQEISRMQF